MAAESGAGEVVTRRGAQTAGQRCIGRESKGLDSFGSPHKGQNPKLMCVDSCGEPTPDRCIW